MVKMFFHFKTGTRTLDFQIQQQMKLFRSQRNFYIVGFTLFLCLVIRKLLGLILLNAEIQVYIKVSLCWCQQDVLII